MIIVARFSDEKEVLRLANDVSYGRAAAVHTKTYERAARATKNLKASTAWGDMFDFVHWSLPLGESKQSGIGREAALENYTETKAVYLHMGMQVPS